MVRVAVTGVDGFVGRHLAAALLQAGHEVRGLVRPGDVPRILPPEVEIVVGDVRNADVVRRALEDCQVVVHLAASFDPRDDVAEIICEGTRHVAAIAQENTVQRLIFLSCLGAQAAGSDFYRAKWEAEQMVRTADVPFTILLPSLILGRGDGITQPLARLIRTLPAVPVPGHGQHRHQPLDVDDLVRCMTFCLDGATAANEMVTVGGPHFLTVRQLIDLLAAHLGVDRPKLLVPPLLLPTLARLLPAPLNTLLQPPRLDLLQQGVVASPGIVQRIFGFEPHSVVPRLAEYLD